MSVDYEKYAAGIYAAIEIYTMRAVDAVRGRLDGIEAQIKALPKPERGEPGMAGISGKNGEPGIQGPKGDGGAAGKDAEPVNVDAIIKAVVAQIPAPKDGKDGQKGESGKDGVSIKGDPGHPGKDAAQVDTEALSASIVPKVLGLIPKPKDGVDGKDAPPIDTKALADEVVQKVLGQIPAPINGRDGKHGESPDANDIVKAVLAQLPPPISGKDATPIDITALSESVVQKVLSLTPAPKNGRDGKDAELPDIAGIVKALIDAAMPEPVHGKDGIDGKDIDAEALNVRIAGEVAKAVAALPKPASGRDGRDGRPGELGEPGKDAADFDILNGMDESMSYQRGVFVKHRNGLFRAYRTTDPVVEKNYEAAGWMCVVPGMVDIVEALGPDLRTVIKTYELSDGSIITSKHKSMAMVYRDVWKAGTEYEQGDNVTVAGALWVAQESTQDRPGISKAWRLAVKRGSDGKDLRPRDDDHPLNGKGSVYLGAKR